MTIIFPCEFSLLLKYLQEEVFLFFLFKSAKLILWGFLNERGRLPFQERTLTQLRSVYWTSWRASCPAGWAAPALPVSPHGRSALFCGKELGKKNTQTSFEMLYFRKSHWEGHCFWGKEGASVNGIKEISICLEPPFLCLPLTGRKV